ncbi:AraC family transcriptional regulator ligand-binding domain-containing protein, partial [Thermodesulfobacteriota bacterium]
MNSHTTHADKSAMDGAPLYNSKITKNYLEFITKYHPEINFDEILEGSGITSQELEDGGHWLTQRQIGRFHKALFERTKNLNLPREVGRYLGLGKASIPLQIVTLGFTSSEAAYRLLARIYPLMSRASTLRVTSLASNKVEAVNVLRPGVVESPGQCRNRIGTFEAIARLFTNKFASVEH